MGAGATKQQQHRQRQRQKHAQPTGQERHAAPSLSAPVDPVIAAALKAATRFHSLDALDEHHLCWSCNDGEALEAALVDDPVHGAPPIRLVDARFFIELDKLNGRLPRRQDLPERAFVPLSRLRRMSKGYLETDLRILCVSYPWLTSSHPDPRGDSLRQLALCLRYFVDDPFTGTGAWAVFLDYCSLPQRGVRGEERSATEAALLSRGLSALAPIYSHPATWTLKLTALPPDYPAAFVEYLSASPNSASYDERGWCFAESAVSNLVKPYTQVLDLSRFEVDIPGSAPAHGQCVLQQLVVACRVGRSAPMTPAEFNARLEEKTFTFYEADVPTVQDLYRAAFEQRFSRATRLAYVDLGWTDGDLACLCRVIETGAVRASKSLDLTSNQITEEGMRLLYETLTGRPRALVAPALEVVELLGNPGSESEAADAARAFARAGVRGGA